VPTVERHDCLFHGEGCRASPTWVSFGLLVPGEGPRDNEIFHHATISKLVLDGVCVLQTCLLKESLKVVCRLSFLVLDTAPCGRDTLLTTVIRFLIIVVVIAGRGCNPLRTPLSSLPATLDILHCALDGDVGWCRSTVARDCFPFTWDRERTGRLLIGGVLGGDIEQLPGGVSDNVVRCKEARWLLHIVHTAPGCICPRSLRAMTVPFLVAVSTSAWVLRAVFRLRTHVPLASLMMRMWFCTPTLLPWQALGRDTSWRGSSSCHGGFCGCLPLVGPRVDQTRG
jgi:hypothetical protein